MNSQEFDRYIFHVPHGAKIFAVAVCAIRIDDGTAGVTSIVTTAYSDEQAIELAKSEACQSLMPLSEYKDHLFSVVEVRPRSVTHDGFGGAK